MTNKTKTLLEKIGTADPNNAAELGELLIQARAEIRRLLAVPAAVLVMPARQCGKSEAARMASAWHGKRKQMLISGGVKITDEWSGTPEQQHRQTRVKNWVADCIEQTGAVND